MVPSSPPTTGNLFGFAEYLSALALLLVVLGTSDYRYRYRLLLMKYNLRLASVWVVTAIGVGILGIDVWFQNKLPVPIIMANANNLKAILAVIFLAFLIFTLAVALVAPPRFSPRNARRFLDIHYHLIHEGDTQKLLVVIEELQRSIPQIVALASEANEFIDGQQSKGKEAAQIAHAFLLLLGEERFCSLVVNKFPLFALQVLEHAKNKNLAQPMFQFARNIGQRFIQNTESAFYQEDSGYFSGLIGYNRPITKIVYGSYAFIEECATLGESALEVRFEDLQSFSRLQMRGFNRAALAFLIDYLKVTKGCAHPRSYALSRLMGSFETAISTTYQLDGLEAYFEHAAFSRLQVTVDFIGKALDLMSKHAAQPRSFRTAGQGDLRDIYDELADLIMKVIFEASAVSSPEWSAWWVQHNTVLSQLFGFEANSASRIVAFRVRRLLYAEIKSMDRFAHFENARYLGFCLLTLGLAPINRRSGTYRKFFPIQALAATWVKKNFARLWVEQPKVARACLMGTISYDSMKLRLVKTYSSDTKKEPDQAFLYVDPADAPTIKRNWFHLWRSKRC